MKKAGVANATPALKDDQATVLALATAADADETQRAQGQTHQSKLARLRDSALHTGVEVGLGDEVG